MHRTRARQIPTLPFALCGTFAQVRFFEIQKEPFIKKANLTQHLRP